MRCADTLAPPPTAGASAATGADDRVSSERARFDAAFGTLVFLAERERA
jgi:hypothetical protein